MPFNPTYEDTKAEEMVVDSSSGNLRKMIGPAKKRLMDYMADAKRRTYDYQTITDMKQLQIAVGEGVDQCTRDLNRVKTTVRLLQDYYNKWLDLMCSLEGKKLAAEQPIYERFADGSSGIIDLIDGSSELIADLETRLDGLRRYSEKIDAEIRAGQTPNPSMNVSGSTSLIGSPNSLIPPGAPPRPKLNVTPTKPPEWDGDIVKYQAWRALYVALIHNNADLTPIEKIYILMTQCLAGAAKKQVEGYELIPTNYDVIWKMLETRFNDANLLKQTLNTELISYRSGFSISSLS